MPAALLLLAQAAAAGPVVPDARGCRPAAPGEVVVCARGGGDAPYRLHDLGPAPAVRARRDPLGFAIPGGGRGRAHAIQTELPGAIGRGAAVSLAVPIGRRKPRR